MNSVRPAPSLGARVHEPKRSALDRVKAAVDLYGFGTLAVAPSLLLLVIYIFYPAIEAVRMSTHDWGGVGPYRDFVGLQNYQDLFETGEFQNAFKVNLVYAAFVVPLPVAIGFLLAAAIHNRVKTWQFLKVVWFVPVVVPSVVIALLFSGAIFMPTIGALDSLAVWLGLPTPVNGWLGDRNLAMLAVVVTSSWHSAGWPMIIFIAGMSRIPQELYESGKVDGATGYQLMRHITFPLLKPVLAAVVTLQVIFSLKAFDIIFVMTEGGPGGATSVLPIAMYEWSFFSVRFGFGAAIAVLMLIGITSIALLQRRFLAIDRGFDD
jgi:raffinose/stachyose/melibiose transport system permease protein